MLNWQAKRYSSEIQTNRIQQIERLISNANGGATLEFDFWKQGDSEQELKSAYRRHCQCSDGTVGREQRGIAGVMSIRDRKRRARILPPLPTATTMRARRMIDAMTGTELRAAAQDCRQQARRRCTGSMRQEPSCQENAAEER